MGVGVTVDVAVDVAVGDGVSVGARVQRGGSVGGRSGVEIGTRVVIVIATRPMARTMPVMSVDASGERDGITSPRGWPSMRPAKTRVYRKMGILARDDYPTLEIRWCPCKVLFDSLIFTAKNAKIAKVS